MKRFVLNARSICLLSLALAGFSLTGCSSVDRTNTSERPWASPTGWQQNGAMGGVLDQQH
jgi:hypothetical protein